MRTHQRFKTDWKRSKRGKSKKPDDVALGVRVEELLNPAAGVKSSPFAQYGVVAPAHVRESVQAVLRVYQADEWRDEFRRLHMAFDRKNEPEHEQESPGEILFENVLMPILASPAMAPEIPRPMRDPTHPLRACHPGTTASGISIASLLDGGVSFIDSADDDLVQLRTSWPM